MLGIKYDLGFTPPLMNVAGFLGYAPDINSRVDYSNMGAFITHPVSWAPRYPSHGKRLFSFPGGFLLHTGYPNPGVKTVIRNYKDAWQRSPLPVWVHLIGEDPDEVAQMVLLLEDLPGVVGIELGLPPAADSKLVMDLIQASLGELPLMVRITLGRISELAKLIARQFSQVALSLGAPYGKLPQIGSGSIKGRLYGPAIYPQAALALEEILPFDLPVIAAGGVYSAEQARSLLQAGAVAVQLDSVLWRNGITGWQLD